MRKLSCLILLVLGELGFSIPSLAQETTPSFLKQYTETRGFSLGRPTRAKVMPEGKSVLFLRSREKNPRSALFEFDTQTGKTREILAPETILKGAGEKLSPEEKARRERQRQSGGGITQFQPDPAGKNLLISLSGKLYLVERASLKVQELQTSPGAIDPRFSPDGKKLSYILKQDVAVYDIESAQESMATTGGTREKTHGIAEFVAQEEMDRFTGYWWSPDSSRIAYEEADHTGVETWYVADPSRPDSPPHTQFYPRPGKKNVRVRLGITSLGSGKTTWVDWDRAKYEYLAGVRWDPQGPLTLLVQDRKQQEQALLLADSQSGKTRTLLVEKDPAFLNLRQDVPVWLPGKQGFLWVGEQPKGWQIELRKPEGDLAKVLLPARPGFNSLLGYSDQNHSILFQDCPDGEMPGSVGLFQLLLPTRDKPLELKAIRAKPGIHLGSGGKDGGTFVVTDSDLLSMPRTVVLQGGKEVGELPSLAKEPPFIPQVKVAKVGPGEGYWTALVLPRAFDPKKKYPVLVDVYGGPKHLTISPTPRHWFLMQWLADQGFIIAAVDNRGTPGRGRDWERSVYGKFGSVPLQGQVEGLQALAAGVSQMDLTRVGIVGWSFGGYMSALAVLKRPDVFHAGIAGAPVTDWEDYDTHYTERYLGLLPADQEAYQAGSLLPLAKDLKRPLLLVHGTADDNVYFRHSLRLAQSLFRAGKEFEILPLAGATHMVPGALDTERQWGRFVSFFQAKLGKPR